MKLPFIILALSSAVAASVQDTNVPARLDYGSFKLISDRNIFNANRSRRGGGGAEEAPRHVDSITLVGTMSYEKGTYAFFDGSSSDYRKVLDRGKSIAGYQLTQIDGDEVKLLAGTNVVELRIGMQLRREEEGEWQVVSASSNSSLSGSDTSSPSSISSSSEDDPVTKKLMQQREQELK
jgi:hypothetical protein